MAFFSTINLLPVLNFDLFFPNYLAFTAVFTSLGASGRYGPTSLGDHYTGQDHDGQVTLSKGIQQWTVPYTGEYQIEAIGAAGGYGKNSDSQYRGRGARMIGTFNLSKEEIIQILIGQEGGISDKKRSGGGGGTFVVRGSITPLIIAGGGGGLRAVKSSHEGCDASMGTAGNPGYRSWSGGSDGYGAQTAAAAAASAAAAADDDDDDDDDDNDDDDDDDDDDGCSGVSIL